MKKILLLAVAIVSIFQSCSKSDVLPEHKLSSITLNKTDLALNPTQTFQFSANLIPENASNTELIWTSSDETVVSVSADGKITAIALGEATITVKNVKYGKSTSANVHVVAVPINGLSLPFEKLSLMVGETQTIEAKATPESASQEGLKWTTSDNSVASVSDRGEVKALKVGNSTITVSTDDGKVSASLILTVRPVIISEISLDKKELRIKVSQSEKLTATISPTNATDQSLIWTSSNDIVATVDQHGNVEAIAEGKATITVKNSDNTVSAKSEVTVLALFDFAELKKSYKANDGLTVTLTDFTVSKNEFGTYSYSISYTLLNETKEAINEGTFKIHNLTKGTSENQYGFFGKFYAGEGTSRSYVFKSTEPLDVLEYNATFFSNKPGDETIKWKAPEVK